MSRGGRDQLGPIERLVRILAVLEGAGKIGAAQDELLDVAQYGGTSPDSQRRMLSKDVKHLNDAGWDITNVADPGTDARYVLHARDIRLRVELTPAEQAELARVGRLAGIDEFADYVGTDAGPPEHPAAHARIEPRPAHDARLTLCLIAAANRQVVQFMYKGRPRTVHPRVVQPGPSGWYLVGWEESSGTEKFFVIDRMKNPLLDKPGTAHPHEEAAHKSLDPATWEVDPAFDVEIETAPEFVEQVKLALHPVVAERAGGDRAVLTLRVTNRSAFRTRLYALGTRVRVLGPDDVRNEITDELAALAGDR
ncbi:MAG TPA: WYL domain-containing protein [Jiangellaceae bacterium]